MKELEAGYVDAYDAFVASRKMLKNEPILRAMVHKPETLVPSPEHVKQKLKSKGGKNYLTHLFNVL